MRKRILVADDHELVMGGVCHLLAARYDIVGTAKDGRALVLQAARLAPDVIVLDIGMPELNGIEAARQIRQTSPKVILVFLSLQLESHYIRAALEAGAKAYVAKQAAAAELLAAVDAALRGEFFISALALARHPGAFATLGLPADPAAAFGGLLTGRQREVLQLIAEGRSVKEIADALNITARTVEFHKGALMDTLGVRTTAELTRYALKTGVVSQE